MNQPLRLEADDPDVLRRTAQAMHDATAIPDPPLQIRCRECGVLLARVGDTPHGTLFSSSWPVNPSRDAVIVMGKELPPKTAAKWIDAHTEVRSSSGPPMRDAVRHGVHALVSPGLADYPDLLVSCEKHGYAVLDCMNVVKWLRQVAAVPPKERKTTKVSLTRGNPDYRAPRGIPGAPSRIVEQHEKRHYTFKVMTVAEYERLRDELDGSGPGCRPGVS